MIELANGLNRFLQLLVVVQPAANLGNTFAPHAELARTSTRVAHRQNENLVAFAAGTFRAIFGMPDDSLQQRAAKKLARYRQLAEKLLARLKGSITNHS